MTSWVRVKEKLPENFSENFVWNGKTIEKVIFYAVFTGDQTIETWVSARYPDIEIHNVTHWKSVADLQGAVMEVSAAMFDLDNAALYNKVYIACLLVVTPLAILALLQLTLLLFLLIKFLW